MDFEFFMAILSAQVDLIFSTIAEIVSVLTAAINALARQIGAGGSGPDPISSSLFGKVGSILSHIWNDYIKRGILGLISILEKLRDRLARILSHVINWITAIRKWYDTHILPILLKQLQMIQRVRQFLALLRIFHVKWAQKLDNYLLDLQGKITGTIELVRGTLNTIISWISLITDPSMIIRRNTLGAWLLSHVGGLKRMVGYGDGRPLTSDEQAAITKAANRYKSANVQDHVTALALTGLTPDDLAEREVARAALVEATGAPLPF